MSGNDILRTLFDLLYYRNRILPTIGIIPQIMAKVK